MRAGSNSARAPTHAAAWSVSPTRAAKSVRRPSAVGAWLRKASTRRWVRAASCNCTHWSTSAWPFFHPLMEISMSSATNLEGRRTAFWLVLLAAAGTFALTMGTRQTMGLFLSPLNTATGLGLGSISLAFAFGQLWWGLTQPFAGAMADKVGAGRVLFAGALLVALGTFITPYMTTTAGLILAIRVWSAGGAGMAGPAVLRAATTRLIPAEKRGLA